MSKTRCSQCIYAKNKATEEPCSKCAEIQYVSYKYENQFIPADKEENEEDGK